MTKTASSTPPRPRLFPDLSDDYRLRLSVTSRRTGPVTLIEAVVISQREVKSDPHLMIELTVVLSNQGR